METEIWKSHPEYAGIEVSTFGRVRSVKGYYYKSSPNSGDYMQVGFSINGKFVNKYVHRLIAQTFIPNLNNLPQVNHKDCDRTNNNVDNLEWCDASYNRKYREKHGISQTEAAGHPLFAINLATWEVLNFRSQNEASRALRVNMGNINAVLNGRIKQTGGYWFVNDDDKADDAIKCKLQEIKKIYS